MNKIVNGVANDYEFEMPPISAYGSINIDELKQVMERLKKIPNYDELIKDNCRKDKEIERLKNIINELEKWLNNNENNKIHYDYESKYDYIYVDELLEKLKELKEGKK